MTFYKDIDEAIKDRIRVLTVLYHETGNKTAREATHADVIIESNHSNNCFLLRRDEPITAGKAVYKEIENYCKAIETYPEELTDKGYLYKLQDEADKAVNNAVIDFYINHRTAATA